MGDCVNEETEEGPKVRTYTEIFEEVFPHYLMMGMTPEQFWDGEADLCRAYREAYRIRLDREDKVADQNAWLHGMYIRDALQSVYLLVNGFVPHNRTAEQYPEKPYSTLEEEKKQHEKTRKQEEARKKKEEQQAQLSMALFQQMAANFNRNFEKRKQEEKAVVT